MSTPKARSGSHIPSRFDSCTLQERELATLDILCIKANGPEPAFRPRILVTVDVITRTVVYVEVLYPSKRRRETHG